ncbi:MAG TPA: single-stranded-DNA-specific exonuclease RecJ [Patescibacteria group bacterium]
MKWHLLTDDIPHTLAELRSLLLTTRQITDEATFFAPRHPTDITLAEVGIDQEQMDLAIKRIDQARKSKEEMLVFGDYDADGISSTAILWQTLYALGCNVKPFIPHREKHGYGLSNRALDEILAKKKPALIVTVDNGIVAHEPAKRLQAAGVDVIITDHHLPEATLPHALAIIHSTKLCGATVAWMFARELAAALGEKVGGKSASVNSALDLGGLATIADQVPLQGANRSFAYHGVRAIRMTKRVGLIELMKLAELTQNSITVTDVNYGLAPRINAMGRLEHGLEALRLLCTSKLETAQRLASTLADTNVRRQDLTSEMVEQARQEADSWKDEHLIIVSADNYHDGVIGLIAGRLMEEYYKPAIVISVTGDIAKASARSIPGVNIVELIREVKSDLLEVGGHPMAAGFGFESKKLQVVKSRLLALAKARIDAAKLEPKIDVEAVLPFELINEELADFLTQFEPFGQGNRMPIFGLRQARVLDAFTMGRDHTHLKLVISSSEAQGRVKPIYTVGWRMGHLAQKLKAGMLIDIAGAVEINEYKGRRNVQLLIKDVVLAEN